MSDVNTHHFPHGDILVVDDNTSDLKYLSSILREAGYTVRPASDGELALRSVQAKLPELILLDINMSGLDGYEVCRRLKAAEDTRDIPVIFISVRTSPLDKVKAFGVGGVDYISKPFDPQEVLARVATHLALWKAQKEVEEKNLQLQQEIAERKQAEEALREAEKRYRDLYDNAPVMYHTIDTKGIVLECNQTEADMLGYSKEEIIGQPVYAFQTKDYQDLVPHALREGLEKGYAFGERRFVRKNGSTFDIVFSATAIYDDLGQVVGFRSTFTDITELRRAEEALRESEETIRALLNAPPDSAVLIDTEGIILAINETGGQRLGKNVDELVGMCIFDFFPPDEAEFRRARAEEVTRLGEPLCFEDKRTGRVLDTHIYPTFDVRGRVERLAILARDITERKRAEEALRESQRFIQEIADATPDMMIYLYDLVEQRNVYVNRQIGEILGYTREEIQEMGSRMIEILVHPDDLESVTEHMKKVATGKKGEIIENEYRMKHAGGEWRWLLSRDSAVFS
jgi:PAS domain S-box-containing protein